MKIALVTGASSGLGREFVRRLGEREELEEIWAVARRREPLEALGKDCGKPVRAVPLDLTRPECLTQLEELLNKEAPEVRVLVNAAGFGKLGRNDALPRQELDDMVLLNCKAAMDVTQLCLPYCSKGSRILEICSCAAFQPLQGVGVYAASKSFLYSYSRSLRWEMLPRGVIVTAVCPYWVKDTAFIPTARGERNSRAVRHFPLAQHTHTVVTHALIDSRLGFNVSTPGIACTVHRVLAKFIIHPIMMLGWEGIRRL